MSRKLTRRLLIPPPSAPYNKSYHRRRWSWNKPRGSKILCKYTYTHTHILIHTYTHIHLYTYVVYAVCSYTRSKQIGRTISKVDYTHPCTYIYINIFIDFGHRKIGRTTRRNNNSSTTSS
jgi:hypothetical protein